MDHSSQKITQIDKHLQQASEQAENLQDVNEKTKMKEPIDKARRELADLRNQSITQQPSSSILPSHDAQDDIEMPREAGSSSSEPFSETPIPDIPGTSTSEPHGSELRSSARKRPNQDDTRPRKTKKTKKDSQNISENQFRVLQYFLRTGMGYYMEEEDRYKSTYWPTKTYLLVHVRSGNGKTIHVAKHESRYREPHCEKMLDKSKNEILYKIKEHLKKGTEELVHFEIFITYSPCSDCSTILRDLTNFFLSGTSEYENDRKLVQVKVSFPQLYNTGRNQEGWFENREGLRMLKQTPHVELKIIRWREFKVSFDAWVKLEKSKTKKGSKSKASELKPQVLYSQASDLCGLLDMTVPVEKVFKLLPEQSNTFQISKSRQLRYQEKQLCMILNQGGNDRPSESHQDDAGSDGGGGNSDIDMVDGGSDGGRDGGGDHDEDDDGSGDDDCIGGDGDDGDDDDDGLLKLTINSKKIMKNDEEMSWDYILL
ncbi:uncharacterized protein [Amphiura filiformis]|uniref:uncharacterized protein n=1 Tax=Amphiura filiformis TaxID=82378 RepID=UPI003B20E914